MITPSPTTKIDPTLARGVLAAVVPETATKAGYVKLEFPNTSYEMHLVPTSPIETPIGKRVVGAIKARARRIDVVRTGGRYVEPVFGRPRRVQGAIVAVYAASDEVVVDAGGIPVHVTTDGRQHAGEFKEGQFVSFDVVDGATFTPVA